MALRARPFFFCFRLAFCFCFSRDRPLSDQRLLSVVAFSCVFGPSVFRSLVDFRKSSSRDIMCFLCIAWLASPLSPSSVGVFLFFRLASHVFRFFMKVFFVKGHLSELSRKVPQWAFYCWEYDVVLFRVLDEEEKEGSTTQREKGKAAPKGGDQAAPPN